MTGFLVLCILILLMIMTLILELVKLSTHQMIPICVIHVLFVFTYLLLILIKYFWQIIITKCVMLYKDMLVVAIMIVIMLNIWKKIQELKEKDNPEPLQCLRDDPLVGMPADCRFKYPKLLDLNTYLEITQ